MGVWVFLVVSKVVWVGQRWVLVKGVCEGVFGWCAWRFAGELECFSSYPLVNPFPSFCCLVCWGVPF